MSVIPVILKGGPADGRTIYADTDLEILEVPIYPEESTSARTGAVKETAYVVEQYRRRVLHQRNSWAPTYEYVHVDDPMWVSS